MQIYLEKERRLTFFLLNKNLLLLITVLVVSSSGTVKATGIDVVTTTLVTSEAVSAESQITVVFTPQTALAVNDTITVYLAENTAGGFFVDTDGTIDSTDVACAQSGSTFDTYVQTDASGTSALLVSCDVASVGGTNPVTVTIGDGAGDDLYNPASADGYPVAVVTNDDGGAGIVYVGNANDVTVSVDVLPNLALTIDNADATNCVTTSGVTACALGTVLTTTVVTGNYDVNVGTSAGSGATLTIDDDGNMRNGADDIDDVVENNTVTAGTEGYGVAVAADVGSWTEVALFDDDDTPIATAPETVATTSGPVGISGDDVTVTHRAAIDSTTKSLTYSHIVTWTATGNF